MLAYALDCLDRAPHHLEAQHLLIEVRAEQLEDEAGDASRKGESDRARKAWKMAGENWSQLGVFRMRAAQCYVLGEHWGEARRSLALLNARSPEHEGWFLFSDMMSSEGASSKDAAVAYLRFLGRFPEAPTIVGALEELSNQLQRLRLIDETVELYERVIWKSSRDDVAPMVRLCDFLLKLPRHGVVVQVIERNRLQRRLGRQYSSAREALAKAAVEAEDWENAGKHWKALAESGADEDQTPRHYRAAGDAFAEAALLGADQYWREAAQCYLKSDGAGSSNLEIAEAEDSARLGNFAPAVRNLSGVVSRLSSTTGPLHRAYTAPVAWKRLKAWADKLDTPELARDPVLLSAVVTLRLHDGERGAAKELLSRVIGAQETRGREPALQRLASIEVEDRNFKAAIEYLDRAEDFSRAWQLAEEHRAELDPGLVARSEGRFLARQYETRPDADRGGLDRAIKLLEEAGVQREVDRLKLLRVERERDIRQKIRLILAEGQGIDVFLQAVSAVNSSTTSDPKVAEAKIHLMRYLVSNPSFLEQISQKLRPVLAGWMRDSTFVLPAQVEFSEEEWGYLIECCQDDLSAKSYYQIRSAAQEWARSGFRRVLGRMRHEFRLQARTDPSKSEFVLALDRELAEVERKWSEGEAIGTKRSEAEVALMRQKLEGETVPQLRERWKQAGIPGTRAATREVLLEGFLEYWGGGT